ncbi:MAG: UvrD-helicase domain-containing protein, partial [Aestuariivirgaceae bacterium]
NAGSGKTHVLVNRVVRLLLDGTVTERVLCLTYTRAAAAEMSRRLYDELAGWIGLSDTALIERIHQHTGHVAFKKGDLAAARQLFARALETPGGLKVQTIHAFCERLLQRFPVEAGMVPGFEVMDEQVSREVLGQARAEVFATARSDATSQTAQDLADIVGHTSADRFDELLGELLKSRDVLAGIVASRQALDAGLDELRQRLGLRPDDDAERITEEAIADIDIPAYQRAASQTCVTKPSRERIERMLLAASTAEKFAALQDIFLTATGAERAESGLVTKNAAQDFPNIHQHLLTEQRRIARLMERWRAVRVFVATGALLRVGAQIIAAYGARKRQLGLSDYDDLILRTSELLDGQHASLWVLFKLDGGLDHVLIDEAQDTSPQQWSIIAKLTEEFFAGEGARADAERTVFAVGDYKQSIFSFQGADPAAFAGMQDYFRSRIADAGSNLTEVPLQVSFRSTPQVLQVVDAVFSQPLANIGLQDVYGGSQEHKARRTGHA